MCKKIVFSIDLLKCPINFLFKSEKQISTYFGTFLSLLIYVILLFFFFQSDMLLKKNPKIFDEVVAVENTQISLNNNDFALSIWFWDADETYPSLDPSLFTIDVVEITFSNDYVDGYVEKSFNLHRCSEGYFETKILDINSSFCLNGTSNIRLNFSKLQWQGYSYNQGDYSFMAIRLNICVNQTNSEIICKPLNEIKQYLQGKYFAVGFYDYLFNLKNYEKPSFTNFDIKEFMIDSNFYQKIKFSLMEVQVFQDDNPISFDGEYLYGTYFQQEPSKYSSNFITFSEEDYLIYNTLIEVQFFAGVNRRIIQRNYQTLFELFSNLGGFATVFKFAFSLLANFCCHVKIIRNLSRKIYVERKNKRKKIKKTENPKKFEIIENVEKEHGKIQINDFFISNSIEMHLRNKKDIEFDIKTHNLHCELVNDAKNQDFHKILSNKIRESTQRIYEEKCKIINKKEVIQRKITMYDYIKYVFHKFFKIKLKETNQIIEETERLYEKDLDLIGVLRKINELEKLKYVILNKRQREMFDIIRFDERDSQSIQERSQKNEEFLLFYKDEINFSKFSDFDKRLLKLLEKQ